MIGILDHLLSQCHHVRSLYSSNNNSNNIINTSTNDSYKQHILECIKTGTSNNYISINRLLSIAEKYRNAVKNHIYPIDNNNNNNNDKIK